MLETKLHHYLKINDGALSRTVRDKIAHTAVSKKKEPALLTGAALSKALDRNRVSVAKFLAWRAARPAQDAAELNAALLALAALANLEIAPGPVYRAWPYKAQTTLAGEAPLNVAPSQIPREVLRMLQNYLEATNGTARQKLMATASVEWDIGIGPLHPFYDGCGRVSRYFSTLLCLWLAVPPRLHSDREKYMAAASRGRRAFQRYVLQQPSFDLV